MGRLPGGRKTARCGFQKGHRAGRGLFWVSCPPQALTADERGGVEVEEAATDGGEERYPTCADEGAERDAPAPPPNPCGGGGASRSISSGRGTLGLRLAGSPGGYASLRS